MFIIMFIIILGRYRIFIMEIAIDDADIDTYEVFS